LGKITSKRRLERFYFLLIREWEILRRRLEYRNAFKKIQRQKRHKQFQPDASKEFRNKYQISPIDPSFSFSEALDQWLRNIRPGYSIRPFPIESLYHGGDKNYPIFTVKGFAHPKLAVVDINRQAFVSYVLPSIGSLLDHKGLKGTKAKSLNPPLEMPPQILSNEDIQVYLNLESRKNGIINELKKLLQREGVQNRVRKESIKTFLRWMKIYDYKKSHPKKPFIKIGQKFNSFYAGKPNPLQLEKCCNDDFNNAVQLIEPRKRRLKKSKSPQDHDQTIDFMGIEPEDIDEDILEVIREEKKNAIQRMDERKISPSKVTPKLWERENQYEPAPIKIFDLEKIRKFDENLKTTEKMIDIKR
jgi:hypothetical protein